MIEEIVTQHSVLGLCKFVSKDQKAWIDGLGYTRERFACDRGNKLSRKGDHKKEKKRRKERYQHGCLMRKLTTHAN